MNLDRRPRLLDHLKGPGDHSLDILSYHDDGEGEEGCEWIVVVAADDEILEILERMLGHETQQSL